MTQPTCEYCDKRGVPILPLRYGVAPAGAGVPVATGPEVTLDAGAAHYTRRLLRSGYLYVYDEARDRWDDYFVTAEGYFFRIHNTPGIPPVLPQKPFNCPDLGHAAVASCITIPDAKRATNAWLGFSDVQWTDAVRARHTDAAYRKRHMRCVNVQAFASSADKAHCLPMAQVGAGVAEYAMAAPALNRALNWGPFTPSSRSGRAQRLVQESERLQPGKGFAVVLEDPVGVTAELDALMIHNLRLLMDNPRWARELAVSSAITQIEAAVREQAAQREIAGMEQLANQQVSANPLGHVLFESTRRQTEALRTVTPEEERRAADRAWARYAAKFDEPRAKAWRASFDGQLQNYDAQFIAPLAVAHAQWLKAKPMADSFACNFDDADADSGLAYTRTFTLCVGDTQDKAACFDVYAEWLNGDITQKGNLLLRALVLNQETTAQAIAKAAQQAATDWRSLPLDGLVGNFGRVTERVAAGTPDVVGRLVVSLLGPMAKWLATAVDGRVRVGMVALGLHTQKTFTVVEVTGGKKAFRTRLIQELIRANGQGVSEQQMRRAVAAELRRLEVAGTPLQGREQKRFLLLVDPQHVRGMPAGLSKPEQVQWLVAGIRTPEHMEAVNLAAWREQVRNPVSRAARGSIPYVAGLLGAVLQYNAMQKLGEDADKAMAHERSEAQNRHMAGVVALGGTIAEMAGEGLKKLGSSTFRLARGLSTMGVWLARAGKAAGITGALVMAWWDLQKAEVAGAEGQHGLKWVYRASAILGVLAAAALMTSWTGVGLILVALLIAVTLFIEHFKDNPLQDWLERCVWGHGPAPRFRTLQEEQQELKLAAAP